MSIPRILLDLDGVIVNFVDGICRALGRENPYHSGATGWNVHEHLGVSEEDFWKPCEAAGFWAGLNWMPDGNRLLALAAGAAGEENVYLLTSPSLAPGSYAGKAEWIARELPNFRRRVLMGPCKHLCAAPGQILIDDADHNVDAFREAGGTAILVPRPWNSAGGWQAVAIVAKELRTAVKRMGQLSQLDKLQDKIDELEYELKDMAFVHGEGDAWPNR